MSGILTGLILSEAVQSLPDHCDVSLARRLLLVAERSYVSAHIKAMKDIENGR